MKNQFSQLVSMTRKNQFELVTASLNMTMKNQIKLVTATFNDKEKASLSQFQQPGRTSLS